MKEAFKDAPEKIEEFAKTITDSVDSLSMISVFTLVSVAVFLDGCTTKTDEIYKSQEPKVIVKKVYIKEEKPKLQNLRLKDLNLTESKPVKLHIKIVK